MSLSPPRSIDIIIAKLVRNTTVPTNEMDLLSFQNHKALVFTDVKDPAITVDVRMTRPSSEAQTVTLASRIVEGPTWHKLVTPVANLVAAVASKASCSVEERSSSTMLVPMSRSVKKARSGNQLTPCENALQNVYSRGILVPLPVVPK